MIKLSCPSVAPYNKASFVSRVHRWKALTRFALALSLCGVAPLRAETDVLVNNYDNYRTGANLSESILNVSNVKSETFGRVFSYAVDGAVMSQPLVATGVSVPGAGRHDVVYVTTTSNSLYAFDAHSGGAPLWRISLTRLPDGTPAPVTGIYSTPVIDRDGGAIYVAAALMQGSEMKYVLHALDLADGSEKSRGPVVVAGSVTIDSTVVPFEPTSTRIAVQRAALAIARGKLIVAFGGDYFEGWVFAYDKGDLRLPPAAFCTTCVSRVSAISGIDYLDRCTFLGPGGGIWQAGRGPVVDGDGMVYFFTGNKAHIIKDGCTIAQRVSPCAACSAPGGCACKGIGSPKVCRGPDTCIANATADGRMFDVNDALIRLDPAAGLALTGWFRPANWDQPGANGLELSDLDLGASGPVFIPGTTRLMGGGKQGVLYMLDTTPSAPSCIASLTDTCMAPQRRNPVQSFQIAPAPPPPNEYYRHVFGGPVIWLRSPAQGGSLAFVWRVNDHLRSYAVSDQFAGCDTEEPPATTSHNCRSVAHSQEFIDQHPGGILAISANGSDAATAIVWASATRAINGTGRLMAFKALPDPSAPERLIKIWDSDACAEDRLEMGSQFIPPTVANGKVYVATGANKVDVFGPLPARECTEQPLPDSLGPMLQ